MLTCYYYIRKNYTDWPPPKPDPVPGFIDTRPDKTAGTVNTLLLVASVIPTYLMDRAARRRRRGATLLGLWLMFAVSIVAIVVRFYEFPATRFSWGDNAYASVLWVTLGLHLTYLLAGAGEFFIMAVWIMRHGIDEKKSLDVTLAGGYWYWVAGIWLPIYVTIYFGPSFL
jgi:heme/copper-type cytochrome/quinol oxidase subunit 3